MTPDRIKEIRAYIGRHRMRPRVQAMIVELCDALEDVQSDLDNFPGEGMVTIGAGCPECHKHYVHHPRCSNKQHPLADEEALGE